MFITISYKLNLSVRKFYFQVTRVPRSLTPKVKILFKLLPVFIDYMSLLIYIALAVSRVFIYVTRPLALGLLIIIFSLILTTILGISVSSWWGIILFLIYVGALLVLFVYVIAISPNCFFSQPKKIKRVNYILIFLIIVIFTFIIFLPSSQFSLFRNKIVITQNPLFIDRFFNISCLVRIRLVLLLAIVAVVYLIPGKRNGAPLRPFN